MGQEKINVTVISNKQKRIVQKLQCRSCHRSFGNASALTRHGPFCTNVSSENVLSDVSLRYECPQCKKTFSSKGYLKQHPTNSKFCKRVQEELALALSETNSSTKSLKCNGCSKEFSQRNGLTSHKMYCHALRLDLEDSSSDNSEVTNPLQCHICTQMFKSKSGLTTHKKFCLLKHGRTQQLDKSHPQQLDKSLPHPQQLDKSLPQLVSKSLPLQVGNSFPQQVDNSHPQQVGISHPEEVDNSHPEQVDNSHPEQVNNSPPQEVDKSHTQQVDMSLTIITQSQQLPLQDVVSDMKCPFCPRVCKNKGSLASHKKACEVKKNPSLLKTRRRLSRSVNVGPRQLEEERDRRLSTTLMVKEVNGIDSQLNYNY